MSKSTPKGKHQSTAIIDEARLSTMTEGELLKLAAFLYELTFSGQDGTKSFASLLGTTPQYIYKAMSGGTFIGTVNWYKIQARLPKPVYDLWHDVMRKQLTTNSAKPTDYKQ